MAVRDQQRQRFVTNHPARQLGGKRPPERFRSAEGDVEASREQLAEGSAYSSAIALRGHASARIPWAGAQQDLVVRALSRWLACRCRNRGDGSAGSEWDGGLVFWFGTLVGGGILVLTGTLLLPRRPIPGCLLTTIGCLAGVLPTMWTLIVPVMLVVLVIASAKQAAAALDTETTPS